MDGLLRHPQPLSAFPFGVVLEIMLYRSYNPLRAITSYMLGKSLVENIKLFHG